MTKNKQTGIPAIQLVTTPEDIRHQIQIDQQAENVVLDGMSFSYCDGTEAELDFTKHLACSIIHGKLTPGLHSTSDWLKLLTGNELSKLNHTLEQAFKEPDSISPDIPNLLLNLVFLETKNKIVVIDELMDYMSRLRLMCQVETCARLGYVEIYDLWRITEPNDDDHYAKLTRRGYIAALEPGAPAFLRYLKERLSGTELS
jgi:hypothetical protein